MITALGINKERYLHQQRVNDIETHMKRCSACGNTNQCDDVLTGGKIGETGIDFCDNAAALTEIAVEQSRAEADS